MVLWGWAGGTGTGRSGWCGAVICCLYAPAQSIRALSSILQVTYLDSVCASYFTFLEPPPHETAGTHTLFCLFVYLGNLSWWLWRRWNNSYLSVWFAVIKPVNSIHFFTLQLMIRFHSCNTGFRWWKAHGGGFSRGEMPCLCLWNVPLLQ